MQYCKVIHLMFHCWLVHFFYWIFFNDQYKVVLKVEERYSRLKSRPVARALQILELKKRPFYESMSIALSALHHNWGEIIFEVAFLLSFTCWDADSLVIFIPRGFMELGISNLPFLGDWGI